MCGSASEWASKRDIGGRILELMHITAATCTLKKSAGKTSKILNISRLHTMHNRTDSKTGFINSRDAAREVKLSHDYINRLCRSGKIVGEMIDGSWYVDAASLSVFLRENKVKKIRQFEARRRTLANEYRKHQPEHSTLLNAHRSRVQQARAVATVAAACSIVFFFNDATWLR
jgi:hypothetical protein